MAKFKIAAAQIAADENVEKNYRKSLEYIKKAAENGAKLICFPEGQLAPYIPQYEGRKKDSFAVAVDHPYIKGFCDACREAHIIGCFGLCIEEGENVYASMMIVSEDGEILGIGKKNHITRFEHFYEQDYFTPGQEGFLVADTSIGKVGVIVCFDRHYPESYRTCVRKGADLIVVPVANEKAEQTDIFRAEIQTAAFQNSVNLIMCNRVGTEGQMDFCGETVFAGPDGEIITLGGDREELLYAELDMDAPKIIREKKQYFSLLRPEVFEV